MLSANDDDYRTAVAQNLINHSANLSAINATLNNTAAVNGSSGVLETQANQQNQIDALPGTSPGACGNGTGTFWLFYTGTDNVIRMTKNVNGTGWTSVASMGIAASSGPTVIYDANASPDVIRIFARDMDGAVGWMWYPASGTGAWGMWTVIIGGVL
jgi:hypothetical protein